MKRLTPMRWRLLAGAAALVAVTAVNVVPNLVGGDDYTLEAVGNRDYRGYGPFEFDISAAPIAGLRPGVTKSLQLKLHNPYGFKLTVTRLRGEVVKTSNARCRPIASNLVVERYVGRLPVDVPARGRATVGSLPVHMPNSVDNACQKVTFSIKLRGTATKAER